MPKLRQAQRTEVPELAAAATVGTHDAATSSQLVEMSWGKESCHDYGAFFAHPRGGSDHRLRPPQKTSSNSSGLDADRKDNDTWRFHTTHVESTTELEVHLSTSGECRRVTRRLTNTEKYRSCVQEDVNLISRHAVAYRLFVSGVTCHQTPMATHTERLTLRLKDAPLPRNNQPMCAQHTRWHP